MKRKKLLICIAIALAPVVIVVYFSLPWLLMLGYIALSPSSPRPEITYAEFPFELTYEINGEVRTIEDVYVCEFLGFSIDAGSMKPYRSWTGYVKSVGDEDLDLVLVQEGNKYICCTMGAPEYYMSDPDYPYLDEPEPMLIAVEKPNDAGGVSSGGISGTLYSLVGKYGLKIISWKFSEPIENSFKHKILFWEFEPKES